MPVWFEVPSATTDPDMFAKRINHMLSRHYSYGRVIVLRTAIPEQRKALAEVKGAYSPL